MGTTVETAPANATVTEYQNRTLTGDELLKTYIRQSAEEDGVYEEFGAERYRKLESQLAGVPAYDGPEFGYYFDYHGTVIRIQIVVLT